MEWASAGRPIPARVSAIGVLGKVGKGDAAARDRLLEAASHPYDGIRGAALQALRDRSEKEAIPPLEKLMARETDQERRTALQSTIDAIRAASSGQEDAGRMRQELQRLRDDQAQLQRRLELLEGKQLRPTTPAEPK
jgi:HEAT repeat protein